jgi:hypothetical protein
MFQATSAHRQEGTIVSIHPLVQHTENKGLKITIVFLRLVKSVKEEL